MTPSIKLLLVEDEAVIRLCLEDALTDGGFTVVTAATGEDAIRELENQLDNLAGLITDIRLGSGLDGWEVARRARELNPYFPIVYSTADSAADWPIRGVPNSIMLQKPFANSQLLVAISTLLNDAAANPASPIDE